jgi:hypothetical protein
MFGFCQCDSFAEIEMRHSKRRKMGRREKVAK